MPARGERRRGAGGARAAVRTARPERRRIAPSDAPERSSAPSSSVVAPTIAVPGAAERAPRAPCETVSPTQPPCAAPSVTTSPTAVSISPARNGRNAHELAAGDHQRADRDAGEPERRTTAQPTAARKPSATAPPTRPPFQPNQSTDARKSPTRDEADADELGMVPVRLPLRRRARSRLPRRLLLHPRRAASGAACPSASCAPWAELSPGRCTLLPRMQLEPAAVSLAWHLHPVPVLLAAAALGLFAQGFARLRRRSPEHAGRRDAPCLFVLAVLVAMLPVVSPLDRVADDYLLSAHMLEHVLIGDVAPALALLAVRGPLVFFLLPQRWLRALARVGGLRRALGFLLRPLVAFVLWTAVTAYLARARGCTTTPSRTRSCTSSSTLTFVVAGVLVWAQLIDPARRGALTVPGRILYAWGALPRGPPRRRT